ncbi:MAG: GTP pyrophosphokinase [Eubacteriales bacterium]|nr:GTP pyrophosphokinase [Eubacteriales bacterium]
MVKEAGCEEEVKRLKKELKEYGFKQLYSEVIRDMIPEINEIGGRLSKKYGRPVMDNISWRVKSPESIAKKLLRKGKTVSAENALETLNDLAGIRIVCSFQDDVFRMSRAIQKIPGFTVVKVKNYIIKPKASGYRSIHIIGEVLYGEETVRIEVQVRSVAMNYWAILDHQLCYKNDNKESEKLRKELRDCAIAIANIDKQFLKLRRQIERI